MISSVYTKYFQKSKIFLYPALMISRKSSITPIIVGTAWENYCGHEDKKLCLVYHLMENNEFKKFEKNKLLGNPLFHEFFELEEDLGMYVFDYSDFKEDWDKFLAGQYSKFSKNIKEHVTRYYSDDKKINAQYIDSFLYPEKYYSEYAAVLGCKEQLLKEVVELCDKPDFEKETLTFKIKDAEVQKNLLTLPKN